MCPAFLQFWCNVIHCKSAKKTDSTVTSVPCMLEHLCYEPFSLKINADLEDMLIG